MPAYDAALFEPPAPVARVTLRNIASGESCGNVPMVLDSGADVTLVPQSPLLRIGMTPAVSESYELAAFDGSISLAPSAIFDLVFLDKTFRGRYLIVDRDHGILGRDLLNHVSLLLDGPRLTWSEATDRSEPQSPG